MSVRRDESKWKSIRTIYAHIQHPHFLKKKNFIETFWNSHDEPDHSINIDNLSRFLHISFHFHIIHRNLMGMQGNMVKGANKEEFNIHASDDTESERFRTVSKPVWKRSTTVTSKSTSPRTIPLLWIISSASWVWMLPSLALFGHRRWVLHIVLPLESLA